MSGASHLERASGQGRAPAGHGVLAATVRVHGGEGGLDGQGAGVTRRSAQVRGVSARLPGPTGSDAPAGRRCHSGA